MFCLYDKCVLIFSFAQRWDVERISDLQAEVERWKTLYEDLLKLNIQQVHTHTHTRSLTLSEEHTHL